MDWFPFTFNDIWELLKAGATDFVTHLNTLDIIVGVLAALLVFVIARIATLIVYKKLKIVGLRLSTNLFISILVIQAFLVFQKFNPFNYGKQVLSGVLFVLGLFLIMRIAEHLIKARRKALGVELEIPRIVRDLIQLTILILGILFAMKAFLGFEVTALIATGTVISAVIGLALQGTLSNIFAGVALQIGKPFEVGEWVTMGNYTGVVVETTWRATKIRTLENNYIALPNSLISEAEIYNFSKPSKLFARFLDIGAVYGEPPNKVKSVLLEAVAANKNILRQPAPTVWVTEYGDFAINYRIRIWLDDFSRHPIIEDEVMTSIWYHFKRNGIGIPFPIRDVNIRTADYREEKRAAEALEFDMSEFLNRIPLLDPLGSKEKRFIIEQSRRVIYATNEDLVRQGDKGEAFFIIMSGEVSVKIATRLRDKEIGRFGYGFFFGEMSLLTGEIRSATVTALKDTEVVIIEKSVFNVILHDKPEVAEAISGIIETRRQQISESDLTDDEIEKSNRKRTEQSAENVLKKIKGFFNME